VNDVIRANGKTAAVCAGGAFLLSLLVGLVSRNPFGVVLLRALLLALLFGVLGGGARFLISRHLPDLLTGAADAAGAAAPAEARGGRVNIVLQEEAAAPADPDAGAQPGVEGLDPMAGEPASADEEQALSELAGELAEDAAAADEPAETAGFSEEGVVDEGEAVGMEHTAIRRDSSSLDALPDIAGLEASASNGSGAAQGAKTRYRAAGGAAADTPAEAMKGALGGQDPATLARAIRTVLKNEEKG
jgi:hypothetical protein